MGGCLNHDARELELLLKLWSDAEKWRRFKVNTANSSLDWWTPNEYRMVKTLEALTQNTVSRAMTPRSPSSDDSTSPAKP